MDDLIAFLRQMLDEEEAAARDAYYEGQHWLTEEEGVYRWPDDELVYMADRKRDAAHIVRWQPARVLREVAAKRAIASLAWNRYNQYDGIPGDLADEILHQLATIYSDHPDYRQEWKPTPDR